MVRLGRDPQMEECLRKWGNDCENWSGVCADCSNCKKMKIFQLNCLLKLFYCFLIKKIHYFLDLLANLYYIYEKKLYQGKCKFEKGAANDEFKRRSSRENLIFQL